MTTKKKKEIEIQGKSMIINQNSWLKLLDSSNFNEG